MWAGKWLFGLFVATLLVDTCSNDAEFIERRLKDYEERHFQFQCGSWMGPYATLHRQLLESDGPYLVSVPHRSGLADRIVGLTSVFMMALLTDRAFQISKLPGLPDMDLAFEPYRIDWRRPLDSNWLLQPLDLYAQTRQYNASVLRVGRYFAINTLESATLGKALLHQDLRHEFSGGQTVFVSTNRGRTIQMFGNRFHALQLHKMGLRRQTAFACLVRFLFRPKPEIFQPVLPIFSRLTDDASILKIAIQIRLGDQTMSPTGGPTRETAASALASASAFNLSAVVAFFKCAEQIERWALAAGGYSGAVWYVASDSAALRAAAVQHYGAKVLTSLATPIEHSAKEDAKLFNASSTVSVAGFQQAAAEWYMQSLAHYHVVTKHSGYGRAAGMSSGRAQSVYTVDRSDQPEPDCSPDGYTSLRTAGKLWSGI